MNWADDLSEDDVRLEAQATAGCMLLMIVAVLVTIAIGAVLGWWLWVNMWRLMP